MKVTPGSVGAVALLAALAMIFGYKEMTRPAPQPPVMHAPIPDSAPAKTPPIVKLEPKPEPAAVPVPRERPCCLSGPPSYEKPEAAKPKVKAKAKKAKAKVKAKPAAKPTTDGRQAPPEPNKQLKRRAKNGGCALFKKYVAEFGVDKVREYIREHLPTMQARAAQCNG